MCGGTGIIVPFDRNMAISRHLAYRPFTPLPVMCGQFRRSGAFVRLEQCAAGLTVCHRRLVEFIQLAPDRVIHSLQPIYGYPPCQAVFDRMRTCDRMQSFIRPQRCGDLMAAGRYDYAQRRVQIKFESLQLFGLIWFSRSGSLRSISHAIRRPPHTSRAPGRGVARAALTPSPPDLDNSPASSACVPLLASNGWVGVSIPSSSAIKSRILGIFE